MSKFQLIHGDCLERMADIPDGSVDMVLCDLPYGTTACKWDTIIPFEPLWAAYRRIAKKNAAIVLTASQPFTSALVMSNTTNFSHSWVWNKKFGGNFVQAKRQPIKIHEDVLVFSFGGLQPRYFPIMVERDTPIKAGKVVNQPNSAIPNGSGAEAMAAVKAKIYDEKYPISILDFSSRENRGLHPTQKPVALMEYLIRTYTNPDETVLDNTMGSGTTGVACINTGRNFIGIERDKDYFRVAKDRIENQQESFLLHA